MPDTNQNITDIETTTSSTTDVVDIPVNTSTSTSASTTVVKKLTDETWTWVKTDGENDIVVTPKNISAFTITLNATGTINGTTDCNNFFGTYKLETNELTFGPLGATKMFCENSQENDFMNILQKVTEYSISEDNNLILKSASGTMMFR